MRLFCHDGRNLYRWVDVSDVRFIGNMLMSASRLIAIMLGVLRMDIDQCIESYISMAPRIFPHEGFISGSRVGKLFKGIKGSARFDATNL